MTIDIRCTACKNADRRRAIELCWNGGMGAANIARLFEGVTAATVAKHVRLHADGDGNLRALDVAPVTPARERVIALQTMQLDEVERRIALAQQRAAEMNAHRDELIDRGAEGAAESPQHDWSEFYDILGKDAQAAIGSILKTQGLTDKRELKTADLKLGLFEAMARNGLAPKAISGAPAPPALTSGDDDDGD